MRHSLVVTFLALGTAAGSFALAACSDDGGGATAAPSTGTGTGGSTGDSGSSGGSPSAGGASAGSCTTTGPVTDPTACPSGKPIFDGCKMDCLSQADAETQCKATSAATAPGPTTDPTCGAGCTCTKCTQAMIDCGTDPEGYCSVILKCANEKGCSGVACYAATTCQAEIDAAPGGGLTSFSVALATEVSNCVTGVTTPGVTCVPKCP